MTQLEKQIKDALIEKRALEMYQFIIDNPENKTMITDFLENIFNTMFNSMIESFGDIDEEEKVMMEGYKNEVFPQLKEQLENPTQLRQIIHEQAKNHYMSCREFREKIKPLFETLREDLEEDVVKEYEKSFDGLYKYIRTNDKIIRKLTKVAEDGGIEKALEKETRYAAIRELFPKAEDYRTFSLNGIKELKNFLQQGQNALMADGELGQFMGKMYGVLGDIVDKSIEISEKVQGDYLEKEIKKIYG